jgi:hypothetical protein
VYPLHPVTGGVKVMRKYLLMMILIPSTFGPAHEDYLLFLVVDKLFYHAYCGTTTG